MLKPPLAWSMDTVKMVFDGYKQYKRHFYLSRWLIDAYGFALWPDCGRAVVKFVY